MIAKVYNQYIHILVPFNRYFLGIFFINTLIFSYPCNENSFGITTARASYFPFWLYVGFACFLMYVYFKGKSLL